MELRQLRCLIAVADSLHFGQAAQKMGILPAAFGRQIRALEDSLGAPLLIRSTRHVSLTPAGVEFVQEARTLLARADALEQGFRTKQGSRAQSLRIGLIDSAASGLMPQLLPAFQDQHPDIQVELFEGKTIRLLPRLLSGRLDLAFVRPPEQREPRLELRRLFDETAVVAVPSGDALAARACLTAADMAEAPLIVPDRRSRPHSHDLTMRLFIEAGLTARVAQIAEEKQTILSLVRAGLGIAIVPRWAAQLSTEGVNFVPLAGQAPGRLTLSAAWLRDTRHAGRDAFLAVLDARLDRLAAAA